MMRSRPKGLTIYRHLRAGDLRFLGPNYQAAVKSVGRTGAQTRSLFQRAGFATQQRALDDWWRQGWTSAL